MNPEISFQLSAGTILKVLVLGTLLFAVLTLIRRLLSVPAIAAAPLRVVRRTLPLLETVIWGLFFLYALGAIFSHPYYYAAALFLTLTIAAVWFSRLVLRDWLAGAVLKMRNAYSEQQMVQIDDIRGTVRKMGELVMEIEQADGEIAQIPYSAITNAVHWKKAAQPSAGQYRFTVTVPKKASLAEAQRELRMAILGSPWAAVNHTPQIHLLEETAQHYRFEANVSSPEPAFTRAIEQDIRKRLSDGKKK